MKRLFYALALSFVLFFWRMEAFAQGRYTSLPASVWDDLLAQRLMAEDEGTEWENLVEELAYRYEHPICINTATREELEQLFFLSPRQVEDILFHIDVDGPLHAPGGLALIPSLDYYTRRLLACFLTFDVPKKSDEMGDFCDWVTKGKSAVMSRMDVPLYTRAGNEPFTQSEWEAHPSRHYWGNALYGSVRYSYRYREHLFWGLSAEKDAGEPFLTRGPDGKLLGRKGFEFYSGYVQVKDLGRLHNLTLGTYRLNFGQGLVMNTNFALGKNMMLSNLGRPATAEPISRHGGTNETDYLRGAAATVRIREVDVTGFASYRRYDASMVKDSISTFLTTGKHRTTPEMQKAGNVRGMLAGGHLRYSWNGLHVGATGLWQHYDHAINKGHLTYKAYYPEGRTFTNWSADYAFYHRFVTLVGETAVSGNGGWATMNTMRVEPFEQVTFTLLHRHYSRSYWGLQSNAFREGGEVRNERGLYLGVDVQRLRNWRFNAYADLFRFPEPRYRVDEPSKGADLMASALYSPNEGLSVFARYRCKVKERNVLSGYSFSGLFREVTQRIRLQTDVALTSSWRMLGTVDYCQVNAEKVDYGFRVADRVTWTHPVKSIHVNGELSWFHTTAWAARLYGYERGLLYAYNYRSYYGQGVRGALMADCKVFNSLVCTVKVGWTHFFDRDEIGTDAERIPQNHTEDLALQLRYTF
ncbi:MAG: hypothetical protein J6T64_10085 [Bacteroidaceae bacterium]|nr:hypothetical protein [Bacteroidaceae bacterium]